jgi:hypothetical protein
VVPWSWLWRPLGGAARRRGDLARCGLRSRRRSRRCLWGGRRIRRRIRCCCTSHRGVRSRPCAVSALDLLEVGHGGLDGFAKLFRDSSVLYRPPCCHLQVMRFGCRAAGVPLIEEPRDLFGALGQIACNTPRDGRLGWRDLFLRVAATREREHGGKQRSGSDSPNERRHQTVVPRSPRQAHWTFWGIRAADTARAPFLSLETPLVALGASAGPRVALPHRQHAIRSPASGVP